MEFDPIHRLLYWSEPVFQNPGLTAIRRVPVADPLSVETIFQGPTPDGHDSINGPIGFDSVDQVVYFAYDGVPTRIARINADGSGYQPILQNPDGIFNIEPAHVIPEPGSLLLMAIGFLGLLRAGRTRP